MYQIDAGLRRSVAKAQRQMAGDEAYILGLNRVNISYLHRPGMEPFHCFPYLTGNLHRGANRADNEAGTAWNEG
jgi:hypothetical protein